MFICERLPMFEGTRVYVGEVRGAQAAVRDERTTEPGSPPRSLQKGERDGREGSRHKASCSWLPSPLPGVRPSAAPAPAAGAHAPQRPRPAAVHGARTMPRSPRQRKCDLAASVELESGSARPRPRTSKILYFTAYTGTQGLRLVIRSMDDSVPPPFRLFTGSAVLLLDSVFCIYNFYWILP